MFDYNIVKNYKIVITCDKKVTSSDMDIIVLKHILKSYNELKNIWWSNKGETIDN